MNNKKLAQRIRKARLEANLSQLELADYLGLSDKSVSAYEAGRATPPLKVLQKMAKKVKKPVVYFAGEDPQDFTIESKLAAVEEQLKQIKELLKKQRPSR